MDEKQYTRSRRVREDRRFDKTQLRASGHGRVVHRDYLAHALRWGWVSRQVKQGEKILDVGCGQDQPLLYILGNKMQTVPELYVGVDLNRILRPSAVRWSRIFSEFDFTTRNAEIALNFGPFDKAVCFEVIEHMGTQDGHELLKGILACLKSGGLLYLSTPVFNGSAAANHLHEWTIPELKAAVESTGFIVKKRIGTFASKPDIKNAMIQANDKAGLEVYDRLEDWFGGDVMACFIAAIYPDASRNNCWVLQKPLAT